MSLTGHVDFISRHGVAGWAADTDNPGAPVDVAIFINGEEVQCISASTPRPDLLQHGWHSADHGFSSLLPVLPTDRPTRVLICHARSDQLLGNGEHIFPIDKLQDKPLAERPRRAHGTKMQPLLVNGIGRSGTTLLVQLLADHPKIVVANLHPYEIMLIEYYNHAYRILTAEGDLTHSAKPSDLGADSYFVGRNPFFRFPIFEGLGDFPGLSEYFNIEIPRILGDAFQKITNIFYKKLSINQQKLVPRYFVEKWNDFHDKSRESVDKIFPNLKEIIIVRDIRDVFCSHRDYFKLHLPPSYLRKDIDYILRSARSQATNKHLVHYEDLVIRQAETTDRIFRFLGLKPLKAGDDALASSLFKRHGTSASPVDSIGRWRHDLSEEDKKLCNEEYREFLEAFGYEGDAAIRRAI